MVTMNIAPSLRTAAVVFGLVVPGIAGAQTAAPPPSAELSPPSEAGAAAIDAALRDWAARMLGGTVDTAAMPLSVAAQDEAYRMELALGGSFFDDMLVLDDGMLAATVKPLEEGRWAILGASLPSKLRGEVRESPGAAPSTLAIGIESQQTTGTIDPALATTSTFSTEITGYTTERRSAEGVQSSRIGRMTGQAEWQPAGPGRVNIRGNSLVEDYSGTSPLPGGSQMTVAIERMTGLTRIENFDVESLAPLLRTAFALGATARADGKPAARPPGTAEEKTLARELLGQVFALLDSFETEQRYTGITLDAGPLMSGSLRRLEVGFALSAPAGQSGFSLRLAMEGLETKLIPEGAWRDIVPHRVALSPNVSGIPKEALLDYLRQAIDTEGANIEEETMRLLGANPVTVGVDDLLVALGPMRLTGGGSVELVNAVEATGRAELRATGLDELIRHANAKPELKMATPVLIFLKGIGRQKGAETIWTITYSDSKMVVNDTDLSDLMPSGR